MHGFVIEPVLWAVTYPVNRHDPTGWIRREHAGYQAMLESEDLGVHLAGDAAAEVVWGRFLERAQLKHEVASHTHGGYERQSAS